MTALYAQARAEENRKGSYPDSGCAEMQQNMDSMEELL